MAECIETKLDLPEDFLLGAASSAHQVEGNNTNSDWWYYEKLGKLPKSGLACDHYNRYDEDFALAERIGLNAMRISIEWARIEPVEGKWDMEAIAHYQRVLQSMRAHGLTRMVTLQHFTLPLWLAEKGGFLYRDALRLFARYAAFVVENLGDEVELWATINEPEVYTFLKYVRGVHPPFKKNQLLVAWQLIGRLIRAHNLAYTAMKQIRPQAVVGIVKNNTYHEPYRRHHLLDRLVVRIAEYITSDYILNKVSDHTDFIGLNYYFSDVLRFSWSHGSVDMATTEPRSDMGWRTFPEGIYHVLLHLKRYRKPIYITENGIANARDDMRQRFIYEHLKWTKKAIDAGAGVRGYFYWTLVDNYEWHDGYGPKFGLVECDFETQQRKIRSSANIFKELR